jgi:hypothetical protein
VSASRARDDDYFNVFSKKLMSRALTERINLPARLRGRRFDAAVATTYTFDPVFFEEYCLERLAAFGDTSSVTVFMDRGTYDAMILGPEHARPKQANLRYLVHPVSVGSTFHPKLWLFVSPDAGRVVVGSANLTRPGFMGNAELIGTYDVEIGKGERWKGLCQQAFAFLVRIEQRWPGRAAASNLREIERQAPWLVSEMDGGSKELFDNLDTPIIETLKTRITGRAVETLYVVSPYFDPTPDLLDDVMKALRPSRVQMFTQNGTTTLTKDWLKHPAVRQGKVEIFLCRYAHNDRPQCLHGKLIAVEMSGQTLVTFGSANFTSPALLRTASDGNVECVVSRMLGRAIDVRKICDPLSSGMRLKDEKDLRSAVSPWEAPPAAKAISLREVTLEGEAVVAELDREPRVEMARVEARCLLRAGTEVSVRLTKKTGLKYVADAPPTLIESAYRASTIVRVVSVRGDRVLGESNWVLLTNLLDIRSGESVRRQRLIRDAYDGPAQFFEVLRNLLEHDEDALREFLALCDIPVTEAPKPFGRRGGKAAWDAEGMRTLQERNLRVFTSLHEAVMSFADRHLRRLRRHVEYGTVAGVENFMHIALAVGGTLRAQMQRLSVGLDALTRNLSPDEWGSYRQQSDDNLEKLREVVLCTTRDYVPTMLRRYGLAKVRVRIEPDIEPFEQVWTDVRDTRNMIEDLRETRLRVLTEKRLEVKPPYNDNVNLMAEKLWTSFSEEMEAELRSVREMLGM